MPKVTKRNAPAARRKTAKPKPATAKTAGLQGSMFGSLAELVDAQDYYKTNVYGRSGTGKTTWWATFPKPIAVIICSGSAEPGELKSINTPEYRDTIHPVVVSNEAEYVKAAEELQQPDSPFATVVLDHATSLQDLVLAAVLNLDKAPLQMSWGTASQQQWGQIGIRMKQHLRSLLDLKTNVVIVAQEREFDSKNESSLLMPTVGSALSPGTSGWLNASVDYVVQTFIRQAMEVSTIKVGETEVESEVPTDDVEYCLRVGAHPIYTTKFRRPKGMGELSEVIVDPDFDKFVAAVNGE